MTQIELEIHDDVISTLNKIKAVNDSGLEIVIPDGSPLFDSIINLKLLRKESEKLQKTLHLNTQDETGLNLIQALESEETNEVVSLVESPDETQSVDSLVSPSFKKPIKFPSLPKFSLKIGNKKLLVFGFVGILGLLVASYYYLSTLPKATVSLVVNSQPLIRSVQLKVKNAASTDTELKQVRGVVITANTNLAGSYPTTGQSFSGEKAKGVAKLYNKTPDEIQVPKNTILRFEEDNKEYEFITRQSVTLPGYTETEPPNVTITPGESTVEIEASNIGPAYNLDSGEALEVEGYKKSEVSAIIEEETKGGTSKAIKIVAEADKTKLSEELLKNASDKAKEDLEKKISLGQKLITGAFKQLPSTPTYSHKTGDETDTLSLSQEIITEGLIYYENDMNKVLDTMVKDFVPEGYVLSDMERSVTVQVLGNTSNTVLNSSEADLQVTLKTYVVPDITEDKIKSELKGLTPAKAEEYLSSLYNIKSYELSIKPTIPFFHNIPTDLNKISVQINRE